MGKTVFAIIAFCFLCICKGTEISADEKVIHADQLNENIKIMGALGLPLGKIVRIDADVIIDESLKRNEGELLLRIYKVEGKTLDKPVSLKYEKIDDSFSFKLNDKVTCIGFETGGFEGLPEDSFKYIQPRSSGGFYFSTSFFILKLIGQTSPGRIQK